MTLIKAGGNWVEGPERFYDREVELKALKERVDEGTHTLLTAQRRMGKTSLVRELLRRFKTEGAFETVFVDLEDAANPADAIAAIAIEAGSVTRARSRISSLIANLLQGVSDRVEEMEVADIRVKLRAGFNAGNWRPKGDKLFADLAHYETRLKSALGLKGFEVAMELLTEAAVGDGIISDDTVDQYRKYFKALDEGPTLSSPLVEYVLNQLEHDGYLERQGGGYRFVSGLVEDWLRARYGQNFVQIAERTLRKAEQ